MSEYGLGRRPEFDERSRDFPIVDHPLVAGRKPRRYTWACGVNLDQGPEGAGVGFSWAAELAARPLVVPAILDHNGRLLYRRAQELDAWPGTDYEGTSVLAGAKAVVELGHLVEYRWAFGVEDLALAVGYAGPAVIGIDWTEAMFEPNSQGFVIPDGPVVGGHAILVRAYSVTKRRFLLHQSWGRRWGGKGDAPMGCAWISYDDLGGLLAAGGDACIPVHRA